MIECAKCGHANRADARFCDRCGAELAVGCPSCGAPNDAGARFCRQCGSALSGEPAPSLQSTASLPVSFASDRYLVRRLLGEGSRKRVYLAHDTRLDRNVAIAEIKTEGLDEGGRLRIRRETQAMARLGDHPNIVTIHDVFEEKGTIFLVSQFMAGGSLEEVLAKQEDHRLEPERALKLGREIASALAHAHSRGIIHRDLKPANVWLSEEGAAKLGDFGLAVDVDQSRLTSEGMIVGTVAYIAPEQALGQAPDARSDLYGLGSILYEALAGRPPFLGDDAVSVISQHVSTPPVGLAWHNPQVGPAVEGLVFRLLAKEPGDRPSSAAEVIKAIDAISSHEIEAGGDAAHPEANPLDRLASGVFVGREREMAELKGYVEDALSGRSLLAMLVGEPGIGKTRMVEEISTYARLRGVQVLLGRCYETEGAPSYWPWIQLIRSYVYERDAALLASEMGAGAANIAEVVSEVREKLPELQPLPRLDAEEARFKLFDSVSTFLRNASRKQPLLIVLDDLHWADKPSLLLLQFLTRELSGSRVLIVGTYRDVELGRHHPLAQVLGELSGQNAVRRISLAGLQESDVARFIRMTSGVNPPSDLVKVVFRETEGNPFFISETVKLLAQEDKLQETSGGSWSVTIPQGVREVLGRRLDRLSAESNSVLAVGSVVGRDFSLNILQRVMDLEKDVILEALEEAMQARVIVEAEGVGRYRFSHALVRETLYDDLSTTRRIRLHAKIGAALESMQAGRGDRNLPELAHHFFESAAAGEVDKAIDYNRRAAERAMSLTAYEEAVQMYDHALQVYELKQVPDEALLCDLYLGSGRAQTSAGETVEARQTFARAAELATGLKDPERMGRAALDAGDVWVSAGWAEEDLIALLESALAMQPEGDSPYRALLLGRLAEALRFTDRKAEEEELTRESVELARRIGDPKVLGQTLFWRVIASGKPEQVDQRRQLSLEILEAAEAAGDLKQKLLGLRNLVLVYLDKGDLAAAGKYLDEYDRLSKEIRLPLFTWFVPLLRASPALLAGRLEEADALAEQAVRLGDAAHDPNVAFFTFPTLLILRRHQARLAELKAMLHSSHPVRNVEWARTGPALIDLDMGDREAAERVYEEFALSGFRSVPYDWGRLLALSQLAELAAGLQNTTAAPDLYDLLLPYRDLYASGITISRGPVRLFLAMLATLLERWEEAEDHFKAGLQMSKKMPSVLHQTVLQAEFAKMLATRKKPGDDHAALELANSALDTARRIGLKDVIDKLLDLKLTAQGARHHSVTESVHVVAAAVDKEKPDLRSHASPDGTVTLLFSDIENSTTLNESVGDERWLKILRIHNSIVRREVAAHKGYEVKNYGDGFMIAFASARLALRCAMAIQKALEEYNRSAEVPVRVRMGLHTGEAMREAGDFFGRNVNLAARVAAEAKGAQILVSSLTRALVSGSSDFRFAGETEVRLKGLSEPQRLSELVWA